MFKKRMLLTAISAFICTSCLLMTPVMHAYAEEPVQKKDTYPVKGEVEICAVFEEGRDYSVRVELCPVFEGGVYHYYTLSPEKPSVIDKIGAGEYQAITYLAEEDVSGTPTGLFSASTGVTVEENPKEISSFVVVVGGKAFEEKYGFELAWYRDDDGRNLRGVYSWSEAKAVVEKTVEEREKMLEENNGSIGIKEEAEEEPEEMVEIPAAEVTEDSGAIKVVIIAVLIIALLIIAFRVIRRIRLVGRR